MATKCKSCGKVVYPMDPKINLDGSVFHRECAKCADCNCQITLSNFIKSESTSLTLLLCKTHYLKRYHEQGAIVGGEKYQKTVRSVSIKLSPDSANSQLKQDEIGKQRLSSVYQCGVTLGTGSFATVYEVLRKSDGKSMAAKLFHKANLSPSDVEAIKKEYEVLLLLDHPHIIKVYDFFEDPMTFVMERVVGGELFDRLEQKGTFTEKEARDIMRNVLSAIKHCHDNNVVHRDLKPENLLLVDAESDVNIKLADFGFATVADGDVLSEFLGTPCYIAPEIYLFNFPKGTKMNIIPCYGKAVDLWSIGVIAFALLSGNFPFYDEEDEGIEQATLCDDLDFDPRDWSGVSEEAVELIKSLLQRDPKQRLTADQALHHPWFGAPDDQLARRTLVGVPGNIRASMVKMHDLEIRRSTIVRESEVSSSGAGAGGPRQSVVRRSMALTGALRDPDLTRRSTAVARPPEPSRTSASQRVVDPQTKPKLVTSGPLAGLSPTKVPTESPSSTPSGVQQQKAATTPASTPSQAPAPPLAPPLAPPIVNTATEAPGAASAPITESPKPVPKSVPKAAPLKSTETKKAVAADTVNGQTTPGAKQATVFASAASAAAEAEKTESKRSATPTKPKDPEVKGAMSKQALIGNLNEILRSPPTMSQPSAAEEAPTRMKLPLGDKSKSPAIPGPSGSPGGSDSNSHSDDTDSSSKSGFANRFNAKKTFADKYNLGPQLGKGTFATVYEAVLHATEEVRAVKVFSKSELGEQGEAAIREEYMVLKLTDHPNIVRVYDFFDQPDSFQMVMESVSGGELLDKIMARAEARDNYTEQEARDVIVMLLSAVKHCHDKNIVHRDIKPENMLLMNDKEDSPIKLADFGFATVAPGDVLTDYVGTPCYIAPEVYAHRNEDPDAAPYGKAADMWSVGVIAYVLLSGFFPFDGEDDEEIEESTLRGIVDFDPDEWTEVSSNAKSFILGLLQSDPQQRKTVDDALFHEWILQPASDLKRRSLANAMPNMRHSISRMRDLSDRRSVADRESLFAGGGGGGGGGSSGRMSFTSFTPNRVSHAARGQVLQAPTVRPTASPRRSEAAHESVSASASAFSVFYRIGAELGKGSFATVFEVFLIESMERRACKILARVGATASREAEVENEYAILKALSAHPNIIKVYELFKDPDSYYMTMEALDGGQLFDRIVEKQYYTENSARSLVAALLATVKHCHDRDIVHRDIKLENLMLISATDDSHIKLVDFGFAVTAARNQLSEFLGTPNYIAPEIYLHDPRKGLASPALYGKPVDLWALGVLTYLLLGGIYPFFSPGQEEDEIEELTMKGAFSFDSEFWGLVSPAAKGLITGLLAQDMDQRLTVDQALAHPWFRAPGEELKSRSLQPSLPSMRRSIYDAAAFKRKSTYGNIYSRAAAATDLQSSPPQSPPSSSSPSTASSASAAASSASAAASTPGMLAQTSQLSASTTAKVEPPSAPSAPTGPLAIPAKQTGFMRKKGRVNKNWKRRFFVLDKGDLAYFKDESSAGSRVGRDQKGELSLGGYVLKEAAAVAGGKKRLVLQSSERTLLVEPEDESSSRIWVTALQKHIAYRNSQR